MTDDQGLLTALRPVLERWSVRDRGGQPPAPRRLSGGLINDTFAWGETHILQRLHGIFDRGVQRDIAALTPHLRAAGVPVPTLVPTRDGALDVAVAAGPAAGIWRVMTRLPGELRPRLRTRAEAHAAGAAAAAFHGALVGVRHDFAFTRPGAHDTPAHIRAAVTACEDRTGHRLHADVAPLVERIAARWTAWQGATGGPPALPTRIVHGDLKAANLLFAPWKAAPSKPAPSGDDGPAPAEVVSAVLDLDTMAHGSLDIELGDALRSWCAPAEDAEHARFDADRFEAAIAGYRAAAGTWLQPTELRALPWAVERIATELAARFAADALHERYFGWDPARAPTRGDHNLLRARNQLALAQDVARQRARLHEAVERTLSLG